MLVEYLEVLNPLPHEERAGHGTVELPRVSVCVEDAMTKKRAHKPKEPLSYKAGQSSLRQMAVDGSKPFPNLSKSVAKIDCHGERK